MEKDVYNHVNVSCLYWSVCVLTHSPQFPFHAHVPSHLLANSKAHIPDIHEPLVKCLFPQD